MPEEKIELTPEMEAELSNQKGDEPEEKKED